MRLWRRAAPQEDLPPTVRDVPIRDKTIRLGQFLKLADLVDSGSDAKQVIVEGLVSVNGETEPRRGRQLARGDVVEHAGTAVRVV